MQCSSCRFENMPGAEVCGRCGSTLRLATMVMDVRPPRAGKFRKAMRRAVPVRQLYYGARDGAETAGITGTARRARARAREAVETSRAETPPWPLVWRAVVPGWPQLFIGQKWRGRAYLWSFLALFVPCLLLMGTTWGSILLGLAFSVHVSAAFDVVHQHRPDMGFGRMMWNSFVVMAGLWMFLYWPGAWALGQVASVRRMEMDLPPLLKSGDVVLVNRTLHRAGYPRAGQVVLYELPEIRLDLQQPRHMIYVIGGERMDRVLAVAGDWVEWDGKHLKVNGKESALRPMAPGDLPARGAMTVPNGHVFILPSMLRLEGAPLTEEEWNQISVVPLEQIEGTPYLRYLPVTRMKVIH